MRWKDLGPISVLVGQVFSIKGHCFRGIDPANYMGVSSVLGIDNYYEKRKALSIPNFSLSVPGQVWNPSNGKKQWIWCWFHKSFLVAKPRNVTAAYRCLERRQRYWSHILFGGRQSGEQCARSPLCMWGGILGILTRTIGQPEKLTRRGCRVRKGTGSHLIVVCVF